LKKFSTKANLNFDTKLQQYAKPKTITSSQNSNKDDEKDSYIIDLNKDDLEDSKFNENSIQMTLKQRYTEQIALFNSIFLVTKSLHKLVFVMTKDIVTSKIT